MAKISFCSSDFMFFLFSLSLVSLTTSEGIGAQHKSLYFLLSSYSDFSPFSL